ncbi:MAG: DUF6978 family protein [Anaerovibrio sp.]
MDENKVSYRLIYKKSVLLIMIYANDKTAHINPDKSFIPPMTPHIHIYSEGLGDKFAMSFHMFMQALLAINDMFFLNSPNVKTIFLEDVSDYLEENNIIYTSNFLARVSTRIEFKFDFQIAGRTSEILISSFNAINRQNLSSFLFDWLDIKEERIRQAKKDVSGLAIINDIEKPVDQQFLNALSAKGTEYILFSQRNTADSIGKLNAA